MLSHKRPFWVMLLKSDMVMWIRGLRSCGNDDSASASERWGSRFFGRLGEKDKQRLLSHAHAYDHKHVHQDAGHSFQSWPMIPICIESESCLRTSLRISWQSSAKLMPSESSVSRICRIFVSIWPTPHCGFHFSLVYLSVFVCLARLKCQFKHMTPRECAMRVVIFIDSSHCKTAEEK